MTGRHLKIAVADQGDPLRGNLSLDRRVCPGCKAPFAICRNIFVPRMSRRLQRPRPDRWMINDDMRARWQARQGVHKRLRARSPSARVRWIWLKPRQSMAKGIVFQAEFNTQISNNRAETRVDISEMAAHMRAHVRHLREHRDGCGNLRPKLRRDFLQGPIDIREGGPPISRSGRQKRAEIPVFIRQTGGLRQRAPFHRLPFACQRQVDTDIDRRMLIEKCCRMGRSSARHHHLNAPRDPVRASFQAPNIRGPARPCVVCPDK